MSRSNNTTRFCDSDPRWMDDDPIGGCYLAGGWHGKHHSCIWPRLILGRRAWNRRQKGYTNFLGTVPAGFRRDVNRMVRGKLNQELRCGKELSDWHKFGQGLIQYYW